MNKSQERMAALIAEVSRTNTNITQQDSTVEIAEKFADLFGYNDPAFDREAFLDRALAGIV